MMPGYQASDSENAYDFFLGFFFNRPTDPISGNAFDGKQKNKGGWLNKKNKTNANTNAGLRPLLASLNLYLLIENVMCFWTISF